MFSNRILGKLGDLGFYALVGAVVLALIIVALVAIAWTAHHFFY